MTEHRQHRILIVGAGGMGTIIGYYLSLAGVDVTFLVRPHRAEALDRPQTLYCYDDNQLKEFKRYTYITDPSKMVGAKYDYVVVTLDGASLKNEAGQSLVKTIGDAGRETDMKVILGSVSFGLRSWFLQRSGLTDEQVTNGFLRVHIHSPKDVMLPLSEQTRPEEVAKADFAYTDRFNPGLILDDSSPAVANGFAEIYNTNGISSCAVNPAIECAIMVYPFFAVFAACELMDWPQFEDIANQGEPWTLAVAAAREIQGLGIYGEAGQQAANMTTEASLAGMLAGFEKQMRPFDMQAFNRFYHGTKLRMQDRAHLRACLASGEADGKPMSALKELLQRVDDRSAIAT